MSYKHKQSGFTIVELLMAAAVFSLVLLVAVIGFIQVGKMFYKSVEIGKTNDAASNILDSVTTDMRSYTTGDFRPNLNHPNPNATIGNNQGWVCIGTHRYTYFLSEYPDPNPTLDIVNLGNPLAPIGLVRDDVGKNSSCNSPFNADGSLNGFKSNAQQMLGDGMSLGKFYISQPNATKYPNLYQVKVVVGFGDNSNPGGVFDFNTPETDSGPGVPNDKMICRGVKGTNFCALSSVDTFITLGQAVQ